ncbi:MAG TPA: apolipoprotein N-acyltransferase [Lentimicrobium sp.]|nr:apolipoprotein N-acyltransferase [Lentimicrobium sp.]
MVPKKLIPFLPVISGLLLTFSWPERGFPLLLVIAFVPLLLLEDIKRKDPSSTRIGIFWMVFPAFFIWNALTTWWIYNATFIGALIATLLNSIMESLMFWLFHFTRKSLKRGSHGYIALIFFWITFEFIHYHWDLNWPWMTLGNAFAAYPEWIQWYEYTGTFGGSLWILLLNILIFKALQKTLGKDELKVTALEWTGIFVLLLAPIIVSYIMYTNYEEKVAPIDVVVVQPNFNPYTEQYELGSDIVINKASQMALTKADSATDFIIFPESMVQPNFVERSRIWENDFKDHPTIELFRKNLITPFPKAMIISGYSTSKAYMDGDVIPSTAREFTDGSGHYDNFNTAVLIAKDAELQLYHKSRLTPGVEMMPFPWLLKPFGEIALDLGGTLGALGTDKERRPFFINDTLKIATIICYESAFGEFVNGFIKNGANAIFVITNDGWWGNTAGHRQHMLFSVIRSIETRRSIARSANTGISCFVNQRGDISQRTAYWEPDVIKGSINANDKVTFYVRNGDYIARGCVLGSVILLLISIVFHFKPEISKR